MGVTIKDIAKVLDISPSTVSRALRGDSRVSDKTIQRVKRIAQRLNYQPNITAQ